VSVAAGKVVIALPAVPSLTQQHGYVHAGAITTIADTACGYAAYSLMPPGYEVLSVEFKTNLLAPASGERLEARARVVKAGRTLSVCQADVSAVAGESETHVATMTATIIGRPSRDASA